MDSYPRMKSVATKVCVEADCVEVIEIMQNGRNSHGLAAAFYEKCSLLASNFISIVFTHALVNPVWRQICWLEIRRSLKPLFGNQSPWVS